LSVIPAVSRAVLRPDSQPPEWAGIQVPKMAEFFNFEQI
jgi:hypothetical protein